MSVKMDHFHVFEEALAAGDPVAALRDVVSDEVNLRGADREAVLMELEYLANQLAAHGREDDEDNVIAVMQFLTGWCSPHVRI